MADTLANNDLGTITRGSKRPFSATIFTDDTRVTPVDIGALQDVIWACWDARKTVRIVKKLSLGQIVPTDTPTDGIVSWFVLSADTKDFPEEYMVLPWGLTAVDSDGESWAVDEGTLTIEAEATP